MSDKYPTDPAPVRERLVPRRTTEKRGGMVEPEGVSPAGQSPFHTRFRSGIPQDTPTPDFPATPSRRSGSHLENELPSAFVEGPVVGPSGESRSMQNPAK